MATEKKLNVVMMAVASITPYEKNSRIHSDGQIQQLCDSISEFGFTNPILIDENNITIAGHGRLTAAIKLGIPEVPTIQISHLSTAQKKAYIIADNKLSLNSGWNQDVLAEELASLAEQDFSMEITGFDFRELDSMNLFGGTGMEDLIELGTEVARSRPVNAHSVLSFGNYRLNMAPSELEALEGALKTYEDTYGLHQGFIGWLTEGK